MNRTIDQVNSTTLSTIHIVFAEDFGINRCQTRRLQRRPTTFCSITFIRVVHREGRAASAAQLRRVEVRGACASAEVRALRGDAGGLGGRVVGQRAQAGDAAGVGECYRHRHSGGQWFRCGHASCRTLASCAEHHLLDCLRDQNDSNHQKYDRYDDRSRTVISTRCNGWL